MSVEGEGAIERQARERRERMDRLGEKLNTGGLLPASAGEAARQAALLARDRKDRRAERMRQAAATRADAGSAASIADAALGPTPEQRRKAEYRTVEIEKAEGSVRAVTALRNVTASRIVQLHSRGIVDGDMFAACDWYRTQWERGDLAPNASISGYGAQVGGDKDYGHLPRSEFGVMARANYRWARTLISEPLRLLFELVVLDEASIDDAAKVVRIGNRTARARFRLAASELHMRIAHVLPIREDANYD